MPDLNDELGRRLKRVPCDLKAEFPDVPLDAIEHDVESETRSLAGAARFNDFVPVLVHKAVRDRLRDAA